jgi:3-hydroxybutyryl-CoA dehydrogenase
MPIDIRQKIRQVGVLGAGTMGNGIAQAFAVAGYSVIMRDIKPEYVERGMATVAKSLERLAARGKLSADARAVTLARIRPTTDINDLGQCDLVVEAVLEDYELKAGIIRELDAICGETAIFATNTPFR